MIIIGCDFHPSFQQIAWVDKETGECGERRLVHANGEAASFYRSLQGKKVCVGGEATGGLRWFLRLLAGLQFEVRIGDPARIRAAMPRKQKTDKRDAEHILQLLLQDRFPAIWIPSHDNQDRRSLMLHRCRMVRLRTRVKNQLDGMAKSENLSAKPTTREGRRQLEAVDFTGWDAHRRQELLELLGDFDERIAPLDAAVQREAEGRPEVKLLMTHPGVGPVVALAFVLIIGDWQRFARGKNVATYLGLIPSEESSGQKRRLGRITKQGNTLLRWLLVEAAVKAQQKDPDWHRQYVRLSMQKHHGVAKVAIARKLAVRLYWMLRSGQNYTQMRERGSHAGQPV